MSLEITFASISAGVVYTCGLTPFGFAFCWGFGPALGVRTIDNQLTPVPVSGGLTLTSISAGDLHTCGVTASGAGFCWGQGGSGQLGNGSTTAEATPVPVAPIP